MPDCERDLTVVTIPPPTANGPLHVGHLSGPFLASDIAARAARARGDNVLAVAGIDIGQNYIATMAELQGIDPGPMMATFRDQILEAFDRGAIGYDAFIDPEESGYDAAIAGLVEDMVARGAVAMAETTLHACGDCGRTLHHSYVIGTCPTCGASASGGSCEGCGGFTSAQTLRLASCDRCGGPPIPSVVTIPVLRLEDYRPQLLAMWLRAELPRQVRDVIAHYRAAELPTIPLAYPTNWGVRGLHGLRIDVYAEVGLAWIYGVARAIDPLASTPDDYVAAWRRVADLWQFHGIDNTFYFALFWPALFAAVGLDRLPLRGLVVNEFSTLDGKKFSTSRNHAVWAHEFLAEEDPAIVRLYLAWTRPDRHSTDFTRESFAAFRDFVRPLLSGRRKAPYLPPALLADERQRGEQALQLVGFDPALAARSLVSLLAGGCDPGPVLGAITGEPTCG